MSTTFSSDVHGLLGQFFYGGAGPSHATLTNAFATIGFTNDDPYQSHGDASLNKQKRVLAAFRFAERKGAVRKLVDELLKTLRLHATFEETDLETTNLVKRLAATLRRDGWELTDAGHLNPLGHINLETGGRQALEDQLDRLRRNVDDPALQIGTAKELLEAVAKFVLEGVGMTTGVDKLDFQPLMHLAIERLDLKPVSTDVSMPGGKAVRTVRQAAQQIAFAVNELRNAQGTGHGRTLPTGVSPEMARYVAREAASLSQWLLSELENTYGV